MKNYLKFNNPNYIGTIGFVISVIGLLYFFVHPLGDYTIFMAPAGFVISIVGLFKKPRFYAVLGTILSGLQLIVVALFLYVVIQAFYGGDLNETDSSEVNKEIVVEDKN